MTQILWTPTPERAEASTLAQFMRWLEKERSLSFADYNEMWRWSIDDLEGFWSAIWEFFDLQASQPWDRGPQCGLEAKGASL